jgi:hypothetical protein
MPEDRNLQRHAAGILELERQTKIDDSVLASMRKMNMAQERISFQESYGAKNRSDLAEKRALAVAAGYSQLGQEGYAQSVISNAVWRYLDGAVRAQVANCTAGEAGRKAAGEFAGMLGVSMSHGNPLEQHIIRQLLGKE